jgi:hypothetical protein
VGYAFSEYDVLAEGSVVRMALFAFFSLLAAFPSCAVSPALLQMPPDRRYMNFVLQKYIGWHDRHFTPLLNQLDADEKSLILRLISKVDHWVVKDAPEYSQFTVSYGVVEDSIKEELRIFIPEDERSSPEILRAKLPSGAEPLFYLTDGKGRRCYVLRGSETDRKDIYCRRKERWAHVGSEIVSWQVDRSWKNPFPFLVPWEIRSLDVNGETTSIFYRSAHTHMSKLPPKLFRVINLHLMEAMLPPDKYSVDRDGKITVYFP